MPDTRKGAFWIRFTAIIATIGLFIADYGFNALAKDPPVWAYAIPGLLALGIEAGAIARLVMQAMRAMARIPLDDQEKPK